MPSGRRRSRRPLDRRLADRRARPHVLLRGDRHRRNAAARRRPLHRGGPDLEQADAEEKCPVAAFALHGRWTGQWSTTRQGGMSVCEVVD